MVNWGAVETQAGWSTEDQAKYAQNKREWENTTDESRKKLLNEENSRIRAKYGVDSDTYGAADAEKAYEYNVQMGNSYLKKGAALDFNIDKSELNKAKEDIENFSYNPEKDAAFLAYRDMAHREGESAAKSTLNQLNAATMGRGNSYSAAATAQVQQAYNQKVSDKAIELADLAYQKLLDRYNIENEEYKAEYARREGEYNRNMDIADRSMNRFVTAEQHDANMENADITNDILGYDRDTYYDRFEADMAGSEANTRATVAGAVGQEMANDRYNELVDAELEQMNASTLGKVTDYGVGDYQEQIELAKSSFYEAGKVDTKGMVTVSGAGKTYLVPVDKAAELMVRGNLAVDEEGNFILTVKG